MPSLPAGKDGVRLVELDSLRGIAAVSVMLFHLTYFHDELGLAPFQVRWGHYGVELFFIISGFVIFMTLARAKNTREFVVSRVARLYPAYWGAIVLTIAFALALEPGHPPFGSTLANFTMLQRALGIGDVDGSYWTLVVELQFYVAIGMLFHFGDLRRIVPIALVALLIGHAVQLAAKLHWVTLLAGVEFGLFAYGAFFVIGICLYLLRTPNPPRAVPALLVVAMLYTIWGGPSASHNPDGAVYLPLTVAITFIAWLASTGRLVLLRWPVLVWLGGISYPLYLLHLRIGTDVMAALYQRGVPGAAAVGLAITLVTLLAWVVHVWIETPARRALRQALTPRSPPAAA